MQYTMTNEPVRFAEGRMTPNTARRTALEARGKLKARLYQCGEYEREAASLPAGSIRRDVLTKLARVERESVREQAPIVERMISKLNGHLVEYGVRPIGRDE